jgi:hypothetical protein
MGIAKGGQVVRPPGAAGSKEGKICGKISILNEKKLWLRSTNFKLLSQIKGISKNDLMF